MDYDGTMKKKNEKKHEKKRKKKRKKKWKKKWKKKKTKKGAKQARDLSSREGAVNEQSLPSSALHLFFLKHGFIFTTTQSREQSAKQSALSKAECKAGRRTRTKQMHACQSVTKAASCAVVTSWWEWSFRAFGASCIIGIACSTAATPCWCSTAATQHGSSSSRLLFNLR